MSTPVEKVRLSTSAWGGTRALRITLPAALLAAAVLSITLPLAASTQSALQPWTGPAAAPPIALNTLDGRPLSLADLKGRVVIVNFWATWCEPCIEEMPSLERLRARLAGQPFEILAVNYQEGPPRIRAFLQKVPVTFPIVRDTDGAVARAWQARVFPRSFIVDAAGKIRYSLTGSADWDTPAIEAAVRALLPAPPARGAAAPRP
ncbi:MAG TPA: TlpA disulfide reductase family protein [Burkholderiaceae bacterium]|nr:TlpA disulfide reductase family protein [Burkholderiaceae bacterium]